MYSYASSRPQPVGYCVTIIITFFIREEFVTTFSDRLVFIFSAHIVNNDFVHTICVKIGSFLWAVDLIVLGSFHASWHSNVWNDSANFQLLFWVNHAITLMVYIVIIVRNVILYTMKLKNRTIYIFGCIRNDVEQDC